MKKYLLILPLFGFVIYSFYLIQMGIRKERKPQLITKEGNFGRYGNIYQLLKSEKIDEKEITEIVRVLSEKMDLKKIKPNYSFQLRTSSPTNDFVSLIISPDITKEYRVTKTESGEILCEVKSFPVENLILKSSGTISSSLYESMLKNDIPLPLILDFADIFEWKIDFFTEVREGDIYKMIFQQEICRGKALSCGKILAAYYEGKTAGKNIAILFEGHYYDLEGNSLERFFLKAPLKYRRISSFFTKRRFHPILRTFKPHYAIDYAAPYGVPVVSVADGVIIFCSWKNGLGKTVIIKHPNGYTTTYGHLSKFAKEIKKYKKVKQGDIIGYVGSTGLSTGPHLHFSVEKDGKYINFLKLKFPPYRKIRKEKYQVFKVVKDKYLNELLTW